MRPLINVVHRSFHLCFWEVFRGLAKEHSLVPRAGFLSFQIGATHATKVRGMLVQVPQPCLYHSCFIWVLAKHVAPSRILP
jgi:hypothetical protein